MPSASRGWSRAPPARPCSRLPAITGRCCGAAAHSTSSSGSPSPWSKDPDSDPAVWTNERSKVMARILTVDDSRSVRMIVVREVQSMGHEVEEAEDGEKGLEKLEAGSFDLVILDVTMPVLDGPGMLAKMRERGNKTPVLMLTSESKRSIIAA